MQVVWLGRAPYPDVEARQEGLRRDLLQGAADEAFLLCEHDPVITLGRSARPEHVLAGPETLAARGIALCRSSRGGDVTYHGPGQLVGYPVVRVTRGVLHHVEALAGAIVDVAAELGVGCAWRRDCPGVWIGDDKLAAFGVHVHRGVAIHGFSLNVTTAPEDFSVIVPCGLRQRGVTSLARHAAELPPLEPLGRRIAARFGARTGRGIS